MGGVQSGYTRQVVEISVRRDDAVDSQASHHRRMYQVSGAYPRMLVRKFRRQMDVFRVYGFDSVEHCHGESP
jgi:hypothetical protein